MSEVVIVAENGQGRYQQSVTVGQHRLLADEPASLGGEDAGPTPFDLVMAGLGACTSITVRMYAERKCWPLTGISVALRHEKIKVDGIAHDRFHRQISLSGELSDEQRQRLLEIAEKCPVHRMLTQSALIESHLTDLPIPLPDQ